MKSVELDLPFINRNINLDFCHIDSGYPFFLCITLGWLTLTTLGIWAKPATASAANTLAASCSSTDVQTAVNSAKDGDIVLVPPGHCTWSSRVTVINKSISLIGSGIGSTIITGNDNSAIRGCALDLITKASGGSPPGFTRVSGFEFYCALASGIPGGYAGGGIVTFSGFSSNVRFDHNKVTITNTSGLYAWDSVKGVADHNTFISNGNLTHMVIWQHLNWDGTELQPKWPAPVGDTSWATPSSFGASGNFFFEDNTFQNTFGDTGYACSDDTGGSRTVYRYNNLINCTLHTHGTETSGRMRGARHREIYRNTGSFNLSVGTPLIVNRGGTGIYFDNTASGNYSYGLVALNTYRRNDLITNHSDGSTPFGRCGTFTATGASTSFDGANTTVTLTFPVGVVYSYASLNDQYVTYQTFSGASPSSYNGTFATAGIVGDSRRIKYKVTGNPGPISGIITITSPFDTPVTGYAGGYRCLDQAGAGMTILYQGFQPNYSPTISPLSPANSALEPIYAWNNILNGLPSHLKNGGLDVAVENRDFYNENTSFDGTTGIGMGILSSMPGTCTTGVAYWATDQGSWNSTDKGGQGVLYKCLSTNNWVKFYTPFPYPHPLVTGIAVQSLQVPEAPTRLVVH